LCISFFLKHDTEGRQKGVEKDEEYARSSRKLENYGN
jgi:hypothetical protein